MRKDILDYPATNERPALWYFGVFQPSSDKTRLNTYIWTGTSNINIHRFEQDVWPRKTLVLNLNVQGY